MNKCLSSLALTPSLFSIAFVSFFWGNNAHMYQPDSLVVSFLVVVTAMAIVASTGFAIRFCWNKLGLDRYWWARLIAGIALGVVILILINTLFRTPLKAMLPSGFARLLFRGIVFCSIVSLLFFHLRHLVRVLNIFFLASICLSVFMAASAFLKDEPQAFLKGETFTFLKDANSASLKHDYANEVPTGDDVSVSLKRTPGIYLFWMESFSEPRIIDKYYDTNLIGEGFPGELEKRGFQFFENNYSNSHYTLASMVDAFSMQLGQTYEVGVQDVQPSGRRLIAGSDENRVLKILKSNGYFTSLITGGRAYYTSGIMGTHLDSSDYVLPTGLLYYYIYPLWELNLREMDKWFDLGAGYSGSLRERVRHAMNLAKSNGKPLFAAFKGGAWHTYGTYDWGQSRSGEWPQKYRDLVKAGISEAMEIIDMIVSDDPDAVIVLLGDHGPARLRGIDKNVDPGIKAFAARLHQNNETLNSFADDKFNVILAVRVPGYSGDISHGLPMSTVNVFRHVFAAINDDPALLENRQPNVSTYNDMQLVIDGKVVQE